MTYVLFEQPLHLLFLLTCLLRGMTEIETYSQKRLTDFYSHASCEA